MFLKTLNFFNGIIYFVVGGWAMFSSYIYVTGDDSVYAITLASSIGAMLLGLAGFGSLQHAVTNLYQLYK